MGMRKHTRSLEWACAAARLVGKDSAPRRDDADEDDDETDEEEAHEALTPKASLIGDASPDVFWASRSAAAKADSNKNPRDPENELMDAALLLCGLGRNVA
jgi:hypothetical protein